MNQPHALKPPDPIATLTAGRTPDAWHDEYTERFDVALAELERRARIEARRDAFGISRHTPERKPAIPPRGSFSNAVRALVLGARTRLSHRAGTRARRGRGAVTKEQAMARVLELVDLVSPKPAYVPKVYALDLEAQGVIRIVGPGAWSGEVLAVRALDAAGAP